MAATALAQAGPCLSFRKYLKLWENSAGDCRSLAADLGVAVIITAKRRRNQPGCPVADRAAVDFHDRQHGLARGSNERLASLIRLLDRKSAFLKSNALRLYHVDYDRSGNALQNVLAERMRDEFAVTIDDPRV